MTELPAEVFARVFASMGELEQMASVLEAGAEVADPWRSVATNGALMGAALISVQLELTESLAFAKRLDREFKKSLQSEQLVQGIKHLRDLMHSEMDKRKLFSIASDAAAYYKQERLFGDEVHAKFSDARADITEAGTCYACGCATAAVFHLMRVAEVGLRALAWDRRIVLPKKKPILLATWDEIIRELENSEQAIQGYKKTQAREAQFAFYHGAMMEFRAFKNVWRNRVMHAREERYDRHQAQNALEHVRGFMQILATRISTVQRTPLIWRKP
jgi:hypothetical protein